MQMRTPEVEGAGAEVERNRRLLEGAKERQSLLNRLKTKAREIMGVPGYAGSITPTDDTTLTTELDGANNASFVSQVARQEQNYRRDQTSNTVRNNIRTQNGRVDGIASGIETSINVDSGERIELFDAEDSDFIYTGSLERKADTTMPLVQPEARILNGRNRCFDSRTSGVIEDVTPAAGVTVETPDGQLNKIEAYLNTNQRADDNAVNALGQFRTILSGPGTATVDGAQSAATLTRVIESEKKLVVAQGALAKGKVLVFDIERGRLVDVMSAARTRRAAPGAPAGVMTEEYTLPDKYLLLNLGENAANTPGLEGKIDQWVKEGKDAVEISGLISQGVKTADPTHGDIAMAISKSGRLPEKEVKFALPNADRTAIEGLAATIANRQTGLIEREERERVLARELDKKGLFGALFFRKQARQVADRESQIPESRKELVRNWALQEAIGQHYAAQGRSENYIRRIISQMIPESQRQANRLMNETTFMSGQRGFDTGLYRQIRTGPGEVQRVGERANSFERFFDNNKNSWWAGLFNRRARTTGATFVGGMGLGYATRSGMATLLGSSMLAGLGSAVGGGALVGGLSGWLRGRREATESQFSGQAWANEMDQALRSNDEGQIRQAVMTAENLLGKRQNELFRNRSRAEALMVIEKHQEGLRRLALTKVARETADGRAELTTDAERRSFAASKFRELCATVTADERSLMDSPAFYSVYKNAILDELRITGPLEEVAAGDFRPIASRGMRRLSAAEQRIRGNLTESMDERIAEKRSEARKMVVGATIKGALTGGIAGGVGWGIGQVVHGLVSGDLRMPWQHGTAPTGAAAAVQTPGVEHGGIVQAPGAEHAGAAPAGPGLGTEHAGAAAAPAGPAQGAEQHWGYFTNENTMPEQMFTPERAHELGLDNLLNDGRCPTTFIDGHEYVGTDQGAALREAVLNWKGQLNFHGMDQNHVANVMNFAGNHGAALPTDVGIGYELSQEQTQAVIDAISKNGDSAVFDANAILADHGMRQAAEAAGVVGDGAAQTGTAAAAEGAATAATEGTVAAATTEAATTEATSKWPGWLLLAGAGLAGLKVGTAVDRDAAKKIREDSDEAAGVRAEGTDAPAAAPAGDVFSDTRASAEQGVAEQRTREIERFQERERAIGVVLTELQAERGRQKAQLEIRDKLDDVDNELFWNADEAETKISALPEPVDQAKIQGAIFTKRTNFRSPGVGVKIQDFDTRSATGTPSPREQAYTGWDSTEATRLMAAWTSMKRADQQIADEQELQRRVVAERERIEGQDRPAAPEPVEGEDEAA